MAYTTTKNYNHDVFSEFVSDLQSAYDWKNVEIAEDGSSANFYLYETVSIKLLLVNTTIKLQIIKGSSIISAVETNGTNGYFMTKTVKTNKVFCFTFMASSGSINLVPTTNLSHIVIGTAVNQLTGAEETGLAFIGNGTGSTPINGYIISSDNLTELIQINTFPSTNANFNSKVTSIQNFFYKNSECVMKDVYVILASQLSSFVFSDCTLNGKKYYMDSGILLADD